MRHNLSDYSIALFGAGQAAVAAIVRAVVSSDSEMGKFFGPLCVPIFVGGLLLAILSLIVERVGASGKSDLSSKALTGFGVFVSYINHLISMFLIIGTFTVASRLGFTILAAIGMFVWGVYMNMAAFCHRQHFKGEV